MLRQSMTRDFHQKLRFSKTVGSLAGWAVVGVRTNIPPPPPLTSGKVGPNSYKFCWVDRRGGEQEGGEVRKKGEKKDPESRRAGRHTEQEIQGKQSSKLLLNNCLLLVDSIHINICLK